MKISLDPKDFGKALKLISTVIDSSEFACLIESKKNKIIVKAEEKGVYICCSLPAEIEKTGSFAVGFSYLNALKFGGKSVSFELFNKEVNFKSGRFRGKLTNLVKTSNLSFSEDAIDLDYTFDFQKFKKGYNALSYSSDILINNVTKYIRVLLSKDKMYFMSNDSYTMGLYKDTHVKMPKDFDMILPDEVLSKIIPSITTNFEFGSNNKSIRIKTPFFDLRHPTVSQEVAAKEARLENAVIAVKNIKKDKKKVKAKVTISVKEALNALSSITSFLKIHDSEKIELSLKKDKCKISAGSTYGSAKDSFSFSPKISKEVFEKISGILIHEFLNRCEKEAVLSFFEGMIMIESDNKTYVMSTLKD